jgi:uncharacterized protein (DUF1015 family)
VSDIRPFRGLRPRPDRAADVAAPPYDTMDYEEAKRYAADRPDTFLRVEKSEIELSAEVDPLDDRIFEAGAEQLARLLDEGAMIRDDVPCLYLYQQTMGQHVQTGLVAGTSVAEYQNDLIKKHEHTRAAKEEERTRHVDIIGANTGPVFLTYHSRDEIDRVVDELRARPPAVRFRADDGVEHVLWVISDPGDVQRLRGLFAEIPHLYVADGHHRSAAASRVQQMRAERNPAHSGDEPYNYFLSVIFPHDQMLIMEYNRHVHDLNGLSEGTLADAIASAFEVEPADSPKPSQAKQFGMYLGGRWHRLRAKPGSYPADDPVNSLDVAILQNNLLGPVLGIGDPRTDKRISFIGGIRGTDELVRRVDDQGGVAFAMYPTSIEELIAIADAGEVMPPKSTWFEPKLRSGMVVRSLED